MDAEQFATLATRLAAQITRRRSLGVVGLLSAAGVGLADEAEAKKKKHQNKKPCPTCQTCPPPPPPAAFCAFKNTCAQVSEVFCGAPGSSCGCLIRADTSASDCLEITGSSEVTTCSDCPSGQVCAILGGACPGAFLCANPCLDPL